MIKLIILLLFYYLLSFFVYSLEVLTTMPLKVALHCVSVVPTKSQILVGLRDGKLIIIAVDRPAEARKFLG